MKGALEGTRIMDLSRAGAGPYGAMLLSDMGAEVIKIEEVPPDDPPAAEPEEVQPTEHVTRFWGWNRNKRGICLDIKKESGWAVFRDLVKIGDVVLDDFRPGVLGRLRIDYDTIKHHNPRIISCSISGFGQNGPWRDQPAFDVMIQALGGSMSITGEPGRMPIRAGIPIGGQAAGIFSAFGVVCALLARERTGVGQRVDVSMLDSVLSLQNARVPQVFGAGMKFGPQPGRSGGGQVPYGQYKTKDGSWIAMAAGAVQFWERLCKIVGREDLITDPRFSTLAMRREHEEEVSAIFEEALLAKTAKEWEQLFFEAGLPAGMVNTIEQAFLHPQAKARNMLVSVDHPLGRKMKFAGNPVKMSATSDEEFGPAPGIGEHTVEVLSSSLGYPQDKIRKLREERAIWYPEKGVSYARDVSRFA